MSSPSSLEDSSRPAPADDAANERPATAPHSPSTPPTPASPAALPASSARFWWLDYVDSAIILVFYSYLVYNALSDVMATGKFGSLVILSSETIVVVFLLIRRRSRDISPRPLDWFFAITATVSPLLFQFHAVAPYVWQDTFNLVGNVLILMGVVIQVWAKLTLGRSIGCVAAHRGLVTSGPYYYVRHPMYCGYGISHIGALMVFPLPVNFAIYIIAWSLQIPRLLAEERLLKNDPEYRRYCEEVPYRLIPGIF